MLGLLLARCVTRDQPVTGVIIRPGCRAKDDILRPLLLVAVSTYYICIVVVVEVAVVVVAYYTCMFVSVADVIYTTIK